MSVRTIIDIPRNEYDSFVELIGSDPEIPASYEEWEIKRSNAIEKYSAGSDVLQFVTVKYEVFADYIRRTGEAPTYYLLASVFGALVTQGRWEADVDS